MMNISELQQIKDFSEIDEMYSPELSEDDLRLPDEFESRNTGTSVYEAITNPDISVSTPAGSASGEEMKKDLFRQMKLLMDA